MPTYAYACADCGHAFDIVQSFADDSLTICPECQGRLRKQFNAVGVVFKGSGFYRTDSRSGKSGTATNGAPSTSSPAAAGSSGEKAPASAGAAASTTDSGSATTARSSTGSTGKSTASTG